MATKHIMKCPFCKSSFDIDLEPYVKVNQTRYAHKACYEKAIADKHS